MIQRDYILRMIEEFRRILASVLAAKDEGRWQEVEGTLEQQFQKLLGAGSNEALLWSETELMARVVGGEATHIVLDKMLFLIRLLKEAGDAAVAQGRPEQGREFYLKGLHLLIGTRWGEEPSEHADFAPPAEAFTSSLAEEALPVRTQAMLMCYYEKRGEFGRAEDALYGVLEAAPERTEALDLGISFYMRLRGRSDGALDAGKLPRTELEAGLADLQARKEAVSSV